MGSSAMRMGLLRVSALAGLMAAAASTAACAQADQAVSRGLRGDWLGQKPPGLVPELFAPGVVSTERDEINAVFSPDGREFYFSVFQGGRGYAMMTMTRDGDEWSEPRPVPFAADVSEVDMFMTHDGGRLFYISKRPLTEGGPPSSGYMIWMTEREEGGWAEPRPLDSRINGGSRQLYPTLTRDGILYFGSTRDGTQGSDLFRAAWEDGAFLEPQRLGPAINSEYDETDALIAPDESWMVFTSSDRPDGFGGGDLYVSFRRSDGSWTAAQNMGEGINTAYSEFTPILSPDGRYFFFASGRAGSDDLYWVDAAIIQGFQEIQVEPYLGQSPPGRTPELFAPGVVSTDRNELNASFSPDGREIFFSQGSRGVNTIMTLERGADGSLERVTAPFSGTHSDVDPFYSPDGRRIYFSSKRPMDHQGDSRDSNLWYVEREQRGGWADPVIMTEVNHESADDYYTSITADGTLYFSRFGANGGPGDVYRWSTSGASPAEPELVASPVSTEHSEHDPFVAPDGSYLIFTSDRPGGLGRGDLWVAFLQEDGAWGEPVNMGPEINSSGYDYCAMLSPDGAYLFFTRNVGGNGEIYWVDAAVIEELRPEGGG